MLAKDLKVNNLFLEISLNNFTIRKIVNIDEKNKIIEFKFRHYHYTGKITDKNIIRTFIEWDSNYSNLKIISNNRAEIKKAIMMVFK